VGCYVWYSEEGPGRAADPPSPLLAVPNVTAHSSTASVPITVLLYDGPLLCGFNMAIKWLNLIVNPLTLNDYLILNVGYKYLIKTDLDCNNLNFKLQHVNNFRKQ